MLLKRWQPLGLSHGQLLLLLALSHAQHGLRVLQVGSIDSTERQASANQQAIGYASPVAMSFWLDT
jgi:hypothetical protein